MPQFDVYTNPNKKTRQTFPYIVDIQNPIISELSTRLVIPLGNAKAFQNRALSKLTPEIEYEGETYLLLTPQLTSMPMHLLQDPIGSIEALRDSVINAIDFAITGI
ncbi:MAG: hypothetical protein Alis3KO_36080 [Aliiglaciecola sp.]